MMSRKQWATSIALLSAFVMCLACSQPDPVAMVRAYQTTYNSHDVTKLLELVTDDVVFMPGDEINLSGKEELKAYAEQDSVLNTMISITDIEVVSKDAVSFRMTERNDWFELLGIAGLEYKPCRIVLQNGKIRLLRVQETTESSSLSSAVVERFAEWIVVEHAAEVERLERSGFGIENAEISMRLGKLWQEALALGRDQGPSAEEPAE